MKDFQGRILRDDLGHRRYLNGEYAHAVLLNELCDMLYADDFSLVTAYDEEGHPSEWSFPALEQAQAKYPWVEDLIDYLSENEQAIGAFFCDFNKAFIQYAKIDENGKSMILNAPVAQESAMNSLMRNYENSIMLSEDAIYGTGVINKDKSKKLLEQWKEVQKITKSPNFDLDEDGEELAKLISNVLRSLGFDINEEWIKKNLSSLFGDSKKNKKNFKRLDKNVSTILDLITTDKKGWKRTFNSEVNYVEFFR